MDSNSNGVTVTLSTRYGSLLNPSISGTYVLANQGGAAPVSPSTADASAAAAASRLPPAAQPSGPPAGGGNIEAALGRAAVRLTEKLANGMTIAVLSIASQDPDMAEFVIDELTYFLVDSRKFKVVDRRSLDAVRAEANFQYSGDVDDNSAVCHRQAAWRHCGNDRNY